MNEMKLVSEISLKYAFKYVEKLEEKLGKDYEYARGFRDCLEFLSLLEEKSPQSCNSKGTSRLKNILQPYCKAESE